MPVAASLLAVGTLTACGADTSEATTIDSAPIVIGDGPSRPVPSQDPLTASAYDPRADLDIEDQSGDGRSVAIESVRVSRDNVYLVIVDDRGSILGTKPILPGVQPVKIDLQRSISSSGYLFGLLVLDNGDGRIDPNIDVPLLDDDGETVEEDFEYYLR